MTMHMSTSTQGVAVSTVSTVVMVVLSEQEGAADRGS